MLAFRFDVLLWLVVSKYWVFGSAVGTVFSCVMSRLTICVVCIMLW